VKASNDVSLQFNFAVIFIDCESVVSYSDYGHLCSLIKNLGQTLAPYMTKFI